MSMNTKITDVIQRIAQEVKKLYSTASQSVAGLMSAADKKKLDGIATGAQVNTLTGVKGNAEKSYRTGNVNITPANIGLGNVDNTADVNKSVASASKLTTSKTIDGVNFDGSTAITHYGVCGTDAATVEKTVTIEGFNLVTGAEVTIQFANSNTVANPTLNINGTGAKAIYYRTSAIPTAYLTNSRVCKFVYDGNVYRYIGDIDTNTNNVTAQNISTANNTYPVLLGATANATANIGNKATLFSKDVKINPSTGTLTANKFIGNVEGDIIGKITGNADTATKLATARKLQVALGSTTAVTFDGSGDQTSIPVSGTLPVARGGTGQTSIANIQAGKDSAGNTITSTYATKTELSNLSKGLVQIVDSLPTTGTEGVIYLVPVSGQTNVYTKHTWENNAWISLGSTVLDLTNYVTKPNAISALAVSGKTITYTKADGTTGTITTQDTNTDTLVTQNVSTTNNNYPLLLTPTANANANQGAKTAIFGNKLQANPSTGTLTATTFSGELSGTAAYAKGLANNKSLGTDYEMNVTSFDRPGYYKVSSFKAGTTSAPTGNNGDYHLFCMSDNNAYLTFLCMTPRKQSLFFGRFWNKVWDGWNEVATTETLKSYLSLTGGTLTGELVSKNVHPLRLIYGSYGLLMRNDGNSFYLLVTAKNDQNGTWTSQRPLAVNLATGVCNINGNAATATKATQDASGNDIANTYVNTTDMTDVINSMYEMTSSVNKLINFLAEYYQVSLS